MESHDIEYGCKMIGGRHTFSYSSFMQWANDAYALSSAREKEEGLWHFELYHGNEWLDIHGIGPIREFQMSIRRIPTRSAVQAAILHKDITGDRPRWKSLVHGTFEDSFVSTMVCSLAKTVALVMGVAFNDISTCDPIDSNSDRIVLLFPRSSRGPAPGPRDPPHDPPRSIMSVRGEASGGRPLAGHSRRLTVASGSSGKRVTFSLPDIEEIE